jgi:hypothetical protein
MRGRQGSSFTFMWRRLTVNFTRDFQCVRDVIKQHPNAVDICITMKDGEQIIVRKDVPSE